MKSLASIIAGLFIALLLLFTPIGPVSAQETDSAGSTTENAEPESEWFVFEGGSPYNFIRAIEKHFRNDYEDIDLSGVLTIPRELENARVPKLRLQTADKTMSARGDAIKGISELIKLYNRLSEKNPALGTWHIEGNSLKPDVLALLSDRNSEGVNQKNVFKVKALALNPIRKSKWESLVREIDRASAISERYAEEVGYNFKEGQVNLQEASEILVCFGTPAYIELVESMVAAFEKNFPPEFILNN